MLPIVPPCCDCSTGQTSFSKGKPVILIGMNGNICFYYFFILCFLFLVNEIIVFLWNFRKIQPLPSISKLLLWKNLASDHKWSGWKWLLASHCQFWDLVLGGLVHHVWGSKNHCPRQGCRDKLLSACLSVVQNYSGEWVDSSFKLSCLDHLLNNGFIVRTCSKVSAHISWQSPFFVMTTV